MPAVRAFCRWGRREKAVTDLRFSAKTGGGGGGGLLYAGGSMRRRIHLDIAREYLPLFGRSAQGVKASFCNRFQTLV